jgi:hypothetical protein
MAVSGEVIRATISSPERRVSVPLQEPFRLRTSRSTELPQPALAARQITAGIENRPPWFWTTVENSR